MASEKMSHSRTTTSVRDLRFLPVVDILDRCKRETDRVFAEQPRFMTVIKPLKSR
jgi:hypothetical protein